MNALPFRVLIITDWALGEAALLSRLEQALSAGPHVAVQHRHPGATDRRFFDEAQQLHRLCEAADAPLFINSRVDVALALGAHVHCTGSSLPPREVRPLLARAGAGLRFISCAVHREGDELEGADLALLSPVFSPRSKPLDARPTLGPDGFARLSATLPCPAFALGGIETTNAGSVKAAGVAVISAVLHSSDPQAATRALLTATSR